MRGQSIILTAVGLCLSACAADSAGSGGGMGGDYAGDGGYYPGEADRDASVSVDAALPPEQEEEKLTFTQPAAGKRFVWVASPENDLAVRIDARTLAIGTTLVGDEPTVIRTRPGEDQAAVFNRQSDELAYVTLDADGRESVDFIPLGHHFDTMDLDPTGRYALAWLDLALLQPGEDSSAMQDLAVVDLDTLRVRNVAVGFRPRQVVFPPETALAIVVTEDGLSLIDLTTRDPGVVPLVPLSADPFAVTEREVAITPDAAFAVSRGPTETGVTVVALPDGEPRFIDLGTIPTDLDLLPGGRTALVMLRDVHQVALVPLDQGEPERIDLSGPLGSAAVAAEGDIAVLYTTLPAENLEPQVTLLNLNTRAVVRRPLRKEIAGIAVDPSGKTAYVLHRKADGDPATAPDEATFLARSHGYSLLDLDSGFARLVTTPAEPAGLLFLPDGSAAYVLVSDAITGVAEVQRLDLKVFEVRTWPLGSPPEVVGVLPEVERAFVTQSHPEGRISFIDLEAAAQSELETVSGYLLNGRIE